MNREVLRCGRKLNDIYGLTFLFLYMPILVLIVFSFNESNPVIGAASPEMVWWLFPDPDITKALYYTFLLLFCHRCNGNWYISAIGF